MKATLETTTRRFVQKKETRHLEKLADHVQALQILFERAEKKAHKKREGGCGCPSCVKRLASARQKLEVASDKYQDERVRLYGKHVDQEL